MKRSRPFPWASAARYLARRVVRGLAPTGLLLLLSLALPVGLSGAPGAPEGKLVGRFLWEIEDPRSSKADYLFGTAHLKLEEGEGLPPAVLEKVAAANGFIMEAEVAGIEKVLGKYILLPQGESLKKMLPPKAWDALVRLNPEALKPEVLERMKPWAVALNFVWPTRGKGPTIDDLLKEQATRSKVPVHFLETAEQQLQMLDSFDDQEDLLALTQTLNDPAEAKASVVQLETAYLSGEVKAMEEAVFRPKMRKEFPDTLKKMFDNRNVTWIPLLEKHFQERDAFVAVGLGHLFGKYGLLELLSAKGYKIRRVPL